MTDQPSLVLLLGAPRSGTTWLQSLLGAHPSVVTPQETDVFSRYLEPLLESWRREERGGPTRWARRRFKGLHGVLTEDELRTSGVALLDAVRVGAGRLKPGARVVLEKTPSHSLCGASIAFFAPEAPVLHLVRDGRDVAQSLLDAGRTWGGWWAPRTLAAAARMWRDHVLGARACAARTRSLELRYEELKTDGAPALERAFELCGVPVTSDECTRLLDELSLAQMTGGAGSILVGGAFASAVDGRVEPEGFFGRGGTGSWRDTWSAQDRLTFDAVAGELLVELGYESDPGWSGSDAARRRFATRTRATRLTATQLVRIGARGDRALRRLP